MKLFYSPGACSLAPHIVLAEIGKPYEVQLVNTMDGSTRSSEYLKITPKGRVPLLSTKGETITEVSAIMTYLALSNPESNLISTTPLGMARTLEWLNWLATVHATAVAQNWRTERFSDETNDYPNIQAKGMQSLKITYQQIDDRLAGSNWAVGNDYSIADPYLLVFFRWGNRLGLDMSAYKNWAKQAVQIEQRPAVKLVLQAEGISIWE